MARTGAREEDMNLVGRDMRGLIGPWLHGSRRWKQENQKDSDNAAVLCPGFEVVLGWLATQASTNWRLALEVIEQWDGPVDLDLGDLGDSWWTEEQRRCLRRRYIRAVLACAYLIPDATPEALLGAHSIASRAASLLGLGPLPPLQPTTTFSFRGLEGDWDDLASAKASSYLRNGHLEESNPLTRPVERSVRLLNALAAGSFILAKAGIPCSIRRAGDLFFLRDEREQKSEASKFLHAVATRGPKNDDEYWTSVRRDLLSLWSWEPFDSYSTAGETGNGIFGAVHRQFLETELLRELLTATRRSDAEQGLEHGSANFYPRI